MQHLGSHGLYPLLFAAYKLTILTGVEEAVHSSHRLSLQQRTPQSVITLRSSHHPTLVPVFPVAQKSSCVISEMLPQDQYAAVGHWMRVSTGLWLALC